MKRKAIIIIIIVIKGKLIFLLLLLSFVSICFTEKKLLAVIYFCFFLLWLIPWLCFVEMYRYKDDAA